MTIAPGKWNITIVQGADFDYTLTLYANRVPIDLTGFTAKMEGRTAYLGLPAPFFTLTTENGGITLGGVAGTVRLYMSAATTSLLSLNGVYDLKLISSGGTTTDRAMQGSVTISPQVTT